MPFSTIPDFISAGLKSFPTPVKVGLAVAALAAIVVTVSGWQVNLLFVGISVFVLILLMVVLVVFDRLAKSDKSTFKHPALFMMWGTLVLLFTLAGLTASTLFLKWPMSFMELKSQIQDPVPANKNPEDVKPASSSSQSKGIGGPKRGDSNGLILERVLIAKDNSPANEYGSWQLVPVNMDMYRPFKIVSDFLLLKDSDIRVLDTDVFLNAFKKDDVVMRIKWIPKAECPWIITDEGDEKYKRYEIPKSIIELVKKSNLFKSGELYNRPGDENGDWHLSVTKYVQSLVKPPTLHLVVRNTGNASVTLYGMSFHNFYFDGGAAGGGTILEPLNDDYKVELTFKHDSKLNLSKPIALEPKSSAELKLQPTVKDAAQGDGPGDLGYQVLIDFHNGEKNVVCPIAYFEQSESVGIDAGS